MGVSNSIWVFLLLGISKNQLLPFDLVPKGTQSVLGAPCENFAPFAVQFSFFVTAKDAKNLFLEVVPKK